MAVDEVSAHLLGGELTAANHGPLRGDFIDRFPIGLGEIGSSLRLEVKPLEESLGAVVERAEGEHHPGACREVALLHLDVALEDGRPSSHDAYDLGGKIPVVVEDTDGACWADRVPIEISEHLLRPS